MSASSSGDLSGWNIIMPYKIDNGSKGMNSNRETYAPCDILWLQLNLNKPSSGACYANMNTAIFLLPPGHITTYQF